MIIKIFIYNILLYRISMLENFLQEVNKRKLTDIEKKKSLAQEMGLVVKSLDELQNKFPHTTFDKFWYNNMQTYRAEDDKILLYTYCASCDVYVSELLEREDDVDDPALQKKVELLKKNNKVLVKICHNCPLCNQSVGDITITRP